jgi:hypothetical protein
MLRLLPARAKAEELSEEALRCHKACDSLRQIVANVHAYYTRLSRCRGDCGHRRALALPSVLVMPWSSSEREWATYLPSHR